MSESHKPLEIAVIGGGVAGVTAAYVLDRRHRVTLFERNGYVGGHTNTVLVPDGPDAGTPVDTGFIVLNDRTYPLLHRLLARLGVGARFADMSFGYHCRKSGLQYSGKSLNSLFAQRGNLLKPSFLRLLYGIVDFGRRTRRELRAGALGGLSLGEYLSRGRWHPDLSRHYVLPMGAAIWSTPDAEMLEFPAETFARFFDNHGLLDLSDRPRWQTVAGGSHAYVRAFLKAFQGEVHVRRPVAGLKREPDGVRLRLADGSLRRFDKAVVAVHADEALALLEDPSAEEKRLLGAWRYQRNRTVLHTDASVLPPNRRAWASWNYARETGSDGERLSVTYDMNNLQGLPCRERYCVTLNPDRPIPKKRIIREIEYTHPTYTFEAIRSQAGLPGLSGVRHTYYCGSYFGYGFHEDAVRSALDVSKLFGLGL